MTPRPEHTPVTHEHSRTPWHYSGCYDHCDVGRDYHEITCADGFEVANQNGILAPSNAAFIVRAVNAHADLVAALEVCLRALREVSDEAGDVAFWNHGGDGYEACSQACDALALAKGEANV